MIGSSLAHATVTANPIAIIAIGIGGALTLAGISVGTLKTAIVAEKDKRFENVKEYLLEQAKNLPENFLTGYCMVLMLEGIQQTMRGCQKIGRWFKHQSNISASKDALAHQQAREFLQAHNYPQSDRT